MRKPMTRSIDRLRRDAKALFAGEPEVAEPLANWAEAHPGQVVEGGPE
jgi:hypothetical protein